MSNTYNADAIEVLTGLDPVRKRPGMYTDTTRPNHLIQEVIDNSVDEALAGHASHLNLQLNKDGSVEVSDDGRGMPVDKHKGEKVSGVELILTRLHAGGKFSNKNYQYSGGLHGVGVSVVNAVSLYLEVTVKRDGKVYAMSFKGGEKASELKAIDTVGKRNTGTTVKFLPDGKYFDSVKISIARLKHVLRAKAVLCSGLRVSFVDNTVSEEKSQSEEWCFEDGLIDYLTQATADYETLPKEPFFGSVQGGDEAVDWAIQWLPEGGETTGESYVNLIPTPLGGTHVSGLRTGLLDALREFCEFRNLLPRGLKLTSDDIWDKCSYVISSKLLDPQFSGQTKERLSSRQCAAFVSGIIKDSFSLWLNQHTDEAELIAELCISNAQVRLKASKQVARKKITSGPALPGKLADCSTQDVMSGELFLVEGDSA
ncbi:MAG: DNA topoisomerase IV subunit B, partial [Gammaproteobacteria bacterium]|nr:DNA topoisomerase IV subunit B [Gammaproteobacteria bacterium]